MRTIKSGGHRLFEQRDLGSLSVPREAGQAGLVVTNPPYGKRLGDFADLVPLYETLGERLKAGFSGWMAAVFTGNPDLTSHLGLRAHRVNVFYNGPIECKLLQFRVGVAFDRAADRPPRNTADSRGPAAGPGPVRPAADAGQERGRCAGGAPEVRRGIRGAAPGRRCVAASPRPEPHGPRVRTMWTCGAPAATTTSR